MRDQKTELYEKRYRLKVAPYHMITADEDWRMLRSPLDRATQLTIDRIQHLYQKGKFAQCKPLFEKLEQNRVRDPASEVIKKFMCEEHKG